MPTENLPVALIAEDDPDVRTVVFEIVQDLAKKIGTPVEIVACQDGEEAIQHMKEFGDRVRLLLTDIRMPKANGAEVIRASQGMRGLNYRYAMSATPGDLTIELRAWCKRIFQKPLDLTDLETALTPALTAMQEPRTHDIADSIGDNWVSTNSGGDAVCSPSEQSDDQEYEDREAT